MRLLLAVIFMGLFCSQSIADDAANEIRGQIVARNHAVISSQLSSLVSTIRVREGDSFKAGDTLVELDCRSFQALLAQAKAAERLAKAVLENTQGLAKMESASVQEVDKARSEVDIRNQSCVLSQLDVERCTIRAPFAGTVLSLSVCRGEYVASGKPLMEIVGSNDLEVHFLVPSTMATQIKSGQNLEMHVYETGTIIKGRVRELAPVADPLNRTIKVFGVLVNEPAAVKPGMSGTIRFL